MRFNLDKIVKNLQSHAPSMYLGTITAVGTDGKCSVLVDGADYPIVGISTLSCVRVNDRVQLMLDKRRIVILGAIQRTDKLVADTIAGGIGGRNLVLDSKLAITTSAYLVRRGRLSEPWVEGATYTVTIKGSVNAPNRFGLWRDSGGALAAYLTDYDAERGVYTATFVCPARHKDEDPYEFSIYNYPSATATSASVEWIKIERGGISTDWMRAPEDAAPTDLMRYLPGNPVGSPFGGFDANTVDRGKPSLIPINNGINTPTKASAVLETIPYSPDWVSQYFHEMAPEGHLFRRTFHSGTTWSAWTQL